MGGLFATETFKSVFAGMFLTTIGIDIDNTEHFFDKIDTLGTSNVGVTAFGTFALDLCFRKISNHVIKV
jgi:hypothetical protein